MPTISTPTLNIGGPLTATTGTFSGAVSMTALTATTGSFSGAVTLSSTLAVAGFAGIGGVAPHATLPFIVRRAGGAGNAALSIDAVVGQSDVQYLADPDSGRTAGHMFYTSDGTSRTLRGGFAPDGQFLIGTTVTTGAAAGEMVLANAKGVRAVNGTSTATVSLISLNANDYVAIGGQTDAADSGSLPRIAYWNAAALPVGSASRNGIIAVDATNNRLIYYSNSGSRYYLTGTAF